ncbi:MAG: LacI family DNA-binding transcriptional regulator [Clostridia bacterium]|nr:LacI family DNA-binding transcriptional regulator [Clostridia bacterium]
MKVYTIRDIAALAGVSVTTVSRVLNNRPDVSMETQERVRHVMEECHFVVNPNARGLKQAEQEIIAVIIRGRNNPFLNALAEEIALCKRPGKAALITEYIDEEADEFRHALGLLRRRRVSGLIFVGSRMDERCAVLEGLSLPMVFATVSTVGTPMERASSVSMDDRKMACEAVCALLQRGHRKIAVFGGERSGQDSLALRALGVKDAFESMGLRFEDDRYVKTRLTLADAYASALDCFRRFPDTTAAFCMSDTAALGVIRALADLGLRVPQDVSVMGVDGIEIGRYTTPSLSTVVQPVQEIARQSMHVLAGLMENGSAPKHVTVTAALEIRESVQ